jgi:hypothetical protein
MKLEEALKDSPSVREWAEATLLRLDLVEEAAVRTPGEHGHLSGAVVACDKALVVFTVERSIGTHGASIHSWRDVSPPGLTVNASDSIGGLPMTVRLWLERPDVDLDSSRGHSAYAEAMIDLWRACSEHILPR